MKDVFYDDLRTLIDALERAGILKRISGAHWNLEIGTINEMLALKKGPATLFDDIPERSFWDVYEHLVSIWQKRDPTLMPLDYYALNP